MSTVIEYVDPIEDVRGWLVYDTIGCRLSVGGCRVQPGLTADMLAELAARMTLKERLLRINVDGAKCGIDYHPGGPAKSAVLGRFVAFLRGELAVRFSAGCDMGTRWPELEDLARLAGLPSIKYAIKTAQQLSHDDFMTRIRLLDQPVGPLTLGERRAGHALAQVAVGAARAAGLSEPLTCSLQGFGNLGRAAAWTLTEARARVVAIADEYGAVADPGGLDVGAMLSAGYGTPAWTAAHGRPLPLDAVFDQPADLMILAATENAMTPEQAAALQTQVVVVGANCGLTPEVERLLYERSVLVISDFVGGIGGSASMEALFGAGRLPDPAAVLRRLTIMMRNMVDDLVDSAHRRRCPVRDVALGIASKPPSDPGGRPYGGCPYLSSVPSIAHAAPPVATIH